MKKLLALLITATLAVTVIAQTKLGGTVKVGGTAKVTVTPPPAGRAIVLNGTTQNININVPAAAPWNSLPAFKIVMRVRGITNDATRRLMTIVGNTYDANLNIGSGSTRVDFGEGRDGLSIFHTPTDLADFILKLQFDPDNTRWTEESWTGACTGNVQNTTALTTTTNLDFSDVWFFGSTTANGSNANAHFDWIYVQPGADALGSCPGADPTSCTGCYAWWKFDADSGVDSSGNGLTLTLVNSPTFENTP